MRLTMNGIRMSSQILLTLALAVTSNGCSGATEDEKVLTLPTKNEVIELAKGYLTSEQGLRAFPGGVPGDPILVWTDPVAAEETPRRDSWVVPVKPSKSSETRNMGWIKWYSNHRCHSHSAGVYH